ncbi:LysR family transcriptional regulator ArgP [Frigoribacterium sp. 2-23]|uniref:LysR family transcriptional regulator ArgP n=1 Tax=Frigoribacterium sp. 2-23 TaxID=3415006 RepID=UPI003C6F870D
MAFQLDQLRTLVALVDEGTFDAAATRLRVTASAVSQRIKALESEAGRVVVQRTNPVTPTEAGDVLLRYARQVVLLDADAARLLGPGISGSAGVDGAGDTDSPLEVVSLPLAVNADSLGTWFLDALARVPAGLAVTFDLHRDDQEHTASLLRSGTVMAAVTSTADPVQGCRTEPLGVMRYLAVCTPGFRDRWLGGSARAARLAAAPVVDFDRKDGLQQRYLAETVGEVSTRRHFVPTSHDFARAVTLGLGWGLLPEQQCRSEVDRGDLVLLSPRHHVDVPLYWQRWTIGSDLLDAVTDAVRAAAREALRRPSRGGAAG